MPHSRYAQPTGPQLAPGWSARALVPPSQLYGANGMRLGDDGRLYVAQCFGSQISAIDVASGDAATVSPVGSEIVAPDDLAFDSHGNLYATEVMNDRVSVRAADGSVRVLSDGLVTANGITVHDDRIFVDEFRVGGRIVELYRDGRAPRVIASELTLPNALAMGPDGRLYFPLVANGEVWRVAPEGGTPERVADGLATPTAVKFDAQGGQLVVTEAGSGAITQIDVVAGTKRRLARLRPGIDNLAFGTDGRLYASHFTDGGITEIARDGRVRSLVAAGLVGPFGLAVDAGGEVYIADGMTLAVADRDGAIRQPANLLMHGFPGYIRGIALAADGTVYTSNSAGGVASYRPGGEAGFIASDLDQAMGVALGGDGRLRVCEAGRGRVIEIQAGGGQRSIAEGLRFPTGIACSADGRCFVAEGHGGRVLELRGRERAVVAQGLIEPHGLAVHGKQLFVLDRGSKTLHAISLGDGQAQCIATALPLGAAAGIVPKLLPGIVNLMPGPLHPFAGLAAGTDGSLYVSGDGDGSVIRITYPG